MDLLSSLMFNGKMLVNYMRAGSFVCFLLAVTLASSNRSFFQRCDTNFDGALDLSEFEQCFAAAAELGRTEAVVRSDVAGLFKAIDADQGGSVSREEYAALQRRLAKRQALSSMHTGTAAGRDEDKSRYKGKEKGSDGDSAGEITVKSRDGSSKTYSRKEFLERMEQQQQGMHGFHRTRNDQLLHEEEKNTRINQLEEKDPALARMIKIAEWSISTLKGHELLPSSAKLVRMTSVPLTRDGRRVSERELSENREQFDFRSLRADLGNKEQFLSVLRIQLQVNEEMLTVEVEVEFNRSKYGTEPHLALLFAAKIHGEEHEERIVLSIPKQALHGPREVENEPSSQQSPSKPKKKKSAKKYIVFFGVFRISLDWIGYLLTMALSFGLSLVYISKRTNADEENKEAANAARS